MKKRHLRDLYVRGKMITLSDSESKEEDPDSSVQLYMKKLNMHENEQAVRTANVARAVCIAATKDPESDIYKSVMADVLDAPLENLVEFLISMPLAEARESVEAELAANPEWDDDDYLQGLNDAWNEGLKDEFIINSEHEEAKRVFEALKRFGDEVEAILESEAASLKRDFESVSEQEVRDRAVKQHLKNRADLDWVDAFRKAELLAAVRDAEDHSKPYFESIDELNELEKDTLVQLLTEYRYLTLDPKEGKV